MPDSEIPSYILEHGRRLSESLLWRLQKNFFESQGLQAWTTGIVPHYITSNGWIADAYAKVVLGWLRDCSGRPGSRILPPLDFAIRSIHWSWGAARDGSASISSTGSSTSSTARR